MKICQKTTAMNDVNDVNNIHWPIKSINNPVGTYDNLPIGRLIKLWTELA
jgi:hypothetical protein